MKNILKIVVTSMMFCVIALANAQDTIPLQEDSNQENSPNDFSQEKSTSTEPFYDEGPMLGGSGYSKSFSTSEQQINYAAIAQAIRAGCKEAQTDRSAPFPVIPITYKKTFFVIQGEAAKWLPPYPTNPDATIHGVDADGDCVRDDIEHYIARKFGGTGNYKLRKYLYEYSVWMDQFLILGLSENTAKTAFNNMSAAGQCVNQIIGDEAALEAINDLFAKFHNTSPRSHRYIDNLPRIGGWTTRERFSVSCP